MTHREERKRGLVLVVTASLLLIVLTSIPAFAALAIASSRGLEWTGRIHLSPGDLAVYLSSISQAAHGTIFLENLATTERLVPVPNAIWSAAGLLARFGDLSPLAAYHLLRVLLIPVFVSVSWAALRHFVPARTPRLIAFALFHFGSGLGAMAALFLRPDPSTAGVYQWPTDLWVGESNAFLSAMYSPHFIASWTLLVASLWMLSKAFATGRLRLAALAGALALLLFQFHPFYAPPLYAVGAAWLALAVLRDGNTRIRPLVAAYAAFVAVSFPAVAYYFWLAKFTLNGAIMLGSNLLLTPSPLHVLIGFGGFFLLAPLGRRQAARMGGETARRADELAIWAIITIVLLYAPISFQRRFLEGLEFPLAALAGVAVVHYRERWPDIMGKSRRYATVAGAMLLASVFLLSSFYGVAAAVNVFGDSEKQRIFFFSKDESAALAWIRTQTPRDALFLSGADIGNAILGWGERRVYAGHWAATIGMEKKKQDIAAFFGVMDPEARASFIRANRIGYVYEGSKRSHYDGALDADSGLERVFTIGDITIYKALQ